MPNVKNQPSIFYGCTELFYNQRNDEDSDPNTHAWMSSDGNYFADRFYQQIVLSKKDGNGRQSITPLPEDVSQFSAVYIAPTEPQRPHFFVNGIELGSRDVTIQRYCPQFVAPQHILPQPPAAPINNTPLSASTDISLPVTNGKWRQLDKGQYSIRMRDSNAPYPVEGYSLVLANEKCSLAIQIKGKKYAAVFGGKAEDGRVGFALHFRGDVPIIAVGDYKKMPAEQNVFPVVETAQSDQAPPVFTPPPIDNRVAVIADLMRTIRGLVSAQEADAFYRKIMLLSYEDQIREAILFIGKIGTVKKEGQERVKPEEIRIPEGPKKKEKKEVGKREPEAAAARPVQAKDEPVEQAQEAAEPAAVKVQAAERIEFERMSVSEKRAEERRKRAEAAAKITAAMAEAMAGKNIEGVKKTKQPAAASVPPKLEHSPAVIADDKQEKKKTEKKDKVADVIEKIRKYRSGSESLFPFLKQQKVSDADGIMYDFIGCPNISNLDGIIRVFDKDIEQIVVIAKTKDLDAKKRDIERLAKSLEAPVKVITVDIKLGIEGARQPYDTFDIMVFTKALDQAKARKMADDFFKVQDETWSIAQEEKREEQRVKEEAAAKEQKEADDARLAAEEAKRKSDATELMRLATQVAEAPATVATPDAEINMADTSAGDVAAAEEATAEEKAAAKLAEAKKTAAEAFQTFKSSKEYKCAMDMNCKGDRDGSIVDSLTALGGIHQSDLEGEDYANYGELKSGFESIKRIHENAMEERKRIRGPQGMIAEMKEYYDRLYTYLVQKEPKESNSIQYDFIGCNAETSFVKDILKIFKSDIERIVIIIKAKEAKQIKQQIEAIAGEYKGKIMTVLVDRELGLTNVDKEYDRFDIHVFSNAVLPEQAALDADLFYTTQDEEWRQIQDNRSAELQRTKEEKEKADQEYQAQIDALAGVNLKDGGLEIRSASLKYADVKDRNKYLIFKCPVDQVQNFVDELSKKRDLVKYIFYNVNLKNRRDSQEKNIADELGRISDKLGGKVVKDLSDFNEEPDQNFIFFLVIPNGTIIRKNNVKIITAF